MCNYSGVQDIHMQDSLGIITVEIDWRYDAGKCRACEARPIEAYCERCRGSQLEPPTLRVLRARVRDHNSNGFVHGNDLIAPRYITRIDQVKDIVRKKLSGKVQEIRWLVVV